MKNTVLMVHLNPVQIDNGTLRVDRKFHVGMLDYAKHLSHRIITLNPVIEPGQQIMDAIDVPLKDLPYTPRAVRSYGGPDHIHPDDFFALKKMIFGCSLVYGYGLDAMQTARQLRVPYVVVLEYDLQTQLKIIAAGSSGLRRWVRSARCLRDHLSITIPQVRAARGVHCNGYPIYEQVCRHNKDSLLYLDSRMSSDQVIDATALEERLQSHRRGPIRLLYSGRYERMKGSGDAVRVAVACLRKGIDVELDCYGQGSLKAEMLQISGGWPQIRIMDAIPYPDLVEAARKADVFVCCHIQSDPSCTYIESMGAGLPLVGYDNRMCRGLLAQSSAGISAPIGQVSAMLEAVKSLNLDRDRLDTLSRRAREFALDHCFEREFSKRVNSINELLDNQEK